MSKILSTTLSDFIENSILVEQTPNHEYNLLNYEIKKLEKEIELGVDLSMSDPIVEEVDFTNIDSSFNIDYISYLIKSFETDQDVTFDYINLLPVVCWSIRMIVDREIKLSSEIFNNCERSLQIYLESFFNEYQEISKTREPINFKDKTSKKLFCNRASTESLSIFNSLIDNILETNSENLMLCNYLERIKYEINNFDFRTSPLLDISEENIITGLIGSILPMKLSYDEIPYLNTKINNKIYGSYSDDMNLFLSFDFVNNLPNLKCDEKLTNYKKKVLSALHDLEKFIIPINTTNLSSNNFDKIFQDFQDISLRKNHWNRVTKLSHIYVTSEKFLENRSTQNNSLIIEHLDTITELLSKKSPFDALYYTLFTYDENIYYEMINIIIEDNESMEVSDVLFPIASFLISNSFDKIKNVRLPYHEKFVGKFLLNKLMEKFDSSTKDKFFIDIQKSFLGDSLFNILDDRNTNIYSIFDYLLDDQIPTYDSLNVTCHKLSLYRESVYNKNFIKYDAMSTINNCLEERNLDLKMININTLGNEQGEFSKPIKLFLHYMRSFYTITGPNTNLHFYGNRNIDMDLLTKSTDIQDADLVTVYNNFNEVYQFIKFNDIGNELRDRIINSYNPQLISAYLKQYARDKYKIVYSKDSLIEKEFFGDIIDDDSTNLIHICYKISKNKKLSVECKKIIINKIIDNCSSNPNVIFTILLNELNNACIKVYKDKFYNSQEDFNNLVSFGTILMSFESIKFTKQDFITILNKYKSLEAIPEDLT